MGRAAARSDAHEDRVGDAAAAAQGQAVEVPRLGRLELGLAVAGQPAQPVDDEQDNLRIRRGRQFLGHRFPVHVRSFRRLMSVCF